MSPAELCPICKGVGRIQVDRDNTTTAPMEEKICHGCDGKGWIEIGGGDYPPAPYWPCYPNPWQPMPTYTITCSGTTDVK